MSKTTRSILLFVVVVLVVIAIWYLESMKVQLPANVGDDTINLSALSATTTSADGTVSTTTLPHTSNYAQLAQEYSPAKELISPDGYINTNGQPITISSLIGNKVILLDFWTYSCINCQRTIPYLNAWYAKYKEYGLEIIGVSTPEFNFEKNINNVQAAVTKFGIQYPVVLDNEDATWTAYGNEYWPEDYLIDINGLVVDRNIGEGNYAQVEEEIQQLLQERATVLGQNPNDIPTGLVNLNYTVNTNSPETYFGSNRNEYLGNGAQGQSGVQTLTAPAASDASLNTLYLGGSWDFEPEYAQNTAANATITYTYDAQDVYFVAAASSSVQITVLRDGVPLTTDRGADVDAEADATINQARLYNLVSQPSMEQHTLQIIVHNPGLQAYTFTFG